MILQQPFAITTGGGINGFFFRSTETVQTGQVPSTQTDFPILINVTDNRFKSTGNGGNVQSTSGFDIRPYSDAALTSALTYELERYNASTGEVVMWVKRSSLADGNITYLAYGKSSLTTDGSSNATWSNSFASVWHLADGSTLNLNDSTSNANTLTNNNTVTAATGQIDGAGGFLSASNQYLTATFHPGPALTLSGWVKATTFPNAYNTMLSFTGGGSASELLVKSTGKLTCFVSATGSVVYDGTGSHTLSTGTWYYLAMSYSISAGMVGYVNAASDNTVAANGNAIQANNNATIGEDRQTTGRRWNGSLDEIRSASVVRSADWITTEYNNQNAPGTFMVLGAEASL